jgi:hypothetical protein
MQRAHAKLFCVTKHGPNNSFKPTPCRGVSHVLCATLARVRRPATGRLNSGVRPLGEYFMDRPSTNVVNAGILFMFSVWIQNQMSDLIILKKNPNLIPSFCSDSKKIPAEYLAIRAGYWEKQFGDVKKEFLTEFSQDLTAQEVIDIEQIYHTRNMIAHAHVSFGRDYMLYRPGSTKKEQAVIQSLKPEPVAEQSNPLMFVLEFWREDVFKNASDQVERLDQICFARLANSLGVPHGRIR